MKKIWKAVTGMSMGEQGLILIHVVVSNDWPCPGGEAPQKSLARQPLIGRRTFVFSPFLRRCFFSTPYQAQLTKLQLLSMGNFEEKLRKLAEQDEEKAEFIQVGSLYGQ
jgi:hypothetical protein